MMKFKCPYCKHELTYVGEQSKGAAEQYKQYDILPNADLNDGKSEFLQEDDRRESVSVETAESHYETGCCDHMIPGVDTEEQLRAWLLQQVVGPSQPRLELQEVK